LGEYYLFIVARLSQSILHIIKYHLLLIQFRSTHIYL